MASFFSNSNTTGYVPVSQKMDSTASSQKNAVIPISTFMTHSLMPFTKLTKSSGTGGSVYADSPLPMSLSDPERKQWNTALTFARYLFADRDVLVDYKVAELFTHGSVINPNVRSADDVVTFEVDQDLGTRFAGLCFKRLSESSRRDEEVKRILDDIVAASKRVQTSDDGTSVAFTFFDAVCVYVRYAIWFSTIRAYSATQNVADGLLHPLSMMLYTIYEATQNQEMLSMFELVQSTEAFRTAGRFPVPLDRDGTIQIASATKISADPSETNYILPTFAEVIKSADQMYAARSAVVVKPDHKDLPKTGPFSRGGMVTDKYAGIGGTDALLVAYLTFVPKSRAEFVGRARTVGKPAGTAGDARQHVSLTPNDWAYHVVAIAGATRGSDRVEESDLVSPIERVVGANVRIVLQPGANILDRFVIGDVAVLAAEYQTAGLADVQQLRREQTERNGRFK